MFSSCCVCCFLKAGWWKAERILTQDLQLGVGVDGPMCVLSYALVHPGVLKGHIVQPQLPSVILHRNKAKHTMRDTPAVTLCGGFGAGVSYLRGFMSPSPATVA